VVDTLVRWADRIFVMIGVGPALTIALLTGVVLMNLVLRRRSLR
jgi:hypothetical protein